MACGGATAPSPSWSSRAVLRAIPRALQSVRAANLGASQQPLSDRARMLATMAPTPAFHPHERRMQAISGTDVQHMAEVGRGLIRSFMPEQHRQFFANQQLMLMSAIDREGRPVADALVGPLGFITSSSPTELRIRPAHTLNPDLFRVGSPIGLLGIELHTRRRNRVNGLVQRVSLEHNTLDISVLQSFGNCPKYIQARQIDLQPAVAAAQAHPKQLSGAAELGKEQQDLIRRADTFFVATCYAGEGADRGAAYIGCDVSHRGGPPGFVRLVGASGLIWPDYVGNWFFNTLGNILANGKVGLLFIDFSTGDKLHLQGTATINLEDRSLPGALRSVSVQVKAWTHTLAGLPLRGTPPQPSPYNPTSAESNGRKRLFAKCRGVIDEADGIKTFAFAHPEPAGTADVYPVDYQPGQYASFDFVGLEGEGKVTNRTWTISSHPDETAASERFTITVKKVGLASGWLHAQPPGNIVLEWRGAGGEFVPGPGTGPVLLLAGGIGITPMRAMLVEFAKRGAAVTLLYSVRAASEAAFLPELRRRAAEASDGRIRVALTVTGPDASWAGRRGRIDRAFIKEQVPDLAACTAYMCGPEAFMQAVEAELHALQFPIARLHRESFAF